MTDTVTLYRADDGDITQTSHVPQLIVGGVVYEREEGL